MNPLDPNIPTRNYLKALTKLINSQDVLSKDDKYVLNKLLTEEKVLYKQDELKLLKEQNCNYKNEVRDLRFTIHTIQSLNENRDSFIKHLQLKITELEYENKKLKLKAKRRNTRARKVL